MDDPYTKLDLGTVDFVDDNGTIFANWDSGLASGLWGRPPQKGLVESNDLSEK